MKKCSKCGEISDNFSPGKRSWCRHCCNKKRAEYIKTNKGVFKAIYGDQRASSRRRGHQPPAYTLQELRKKFIKDPVFLKIYNNWVSRGYQKMDKPSLDRLDDKKGYSFSNVQWVTWRENFEKANRDKKTGKLFSNKPHQPVFQFTKQGEFVDEFISQSDASRKTGIGQVNISNCCVGKQKTAGGFIWKNAN